MKFIKDYKCKINYLKLVQAYNGTLNGSILKTLIQKAVLLTNFIYTWSK